MPKTKRPPVFKVRAEVAVWRPADAGPRPHLMIVEEVLATASPNRSDMTKLLLSTISGKLAHFGIDTATVDLEIERSDFLAARSRSYGGSLFDDEPKWTPAVLDTIASPERDKAIRALTYLPYDLQEQQEVYGV